MFLKIHFFMSLMRMLITKLGVIINIKSLELYTQHRNLDAHIIIMHLKELFNVASKTKRYEISKKLLCFKMIKDSLMNTYMLRMIIYFKNQAN
jgi:hypothetical protein